MARYCIQCGAKNQDNDSVCSRCGMVLKENSKDNPVSQTHTETASNDLFDEKKSPIDTISFCAEQINKDNLLTQNHLVEEIKCKNDFMYILSKQADFSSTEYKVLNSIGNQGLLRCKKLKYNGNDGLYYMTDGLKSLDIMLPSLDSTRFMFILENLFNQINVIKNNGFLTCTGLDVRINRIFIDAKDGKVYLTYLPVNQRCYSDVIYLEQSLRNDLIYIIKSVKSIQNYSVMTIVQMMEEPACTFGNLLSVIRQNRSMSSNNGR